MIRLVLNTDGGARGNPGPAAIGVVIKNHEGTVIKEIGKYIGEKTNNEAEYEAIIEGLSAALEKKASIVDCYLDSEFVVNQLKGVYKVKNERMQVLWEKTKSIEKKFKTVSYTHILRDKNKEADKIVNQVLDSLN
ncbi:reverse transcriptase-like protein [candidate division WWE3 bacterium]|jgi:ribonuclease HI|uniref:Reverse transcriptase-like protein n=1 Tax=candidate division WWE3 bacterium TaxID=2053526 RepID=A0A3A4ZCG0_UNCKA|nr:MAG: reverse transcriptase-like protein [candidate division WWE3 bacterium]